MFKEAIIYYPKDEKMRRQIENDIARFHVDAAMKYMDSLNLTLHEKRMVLQATLQDIKKNMEQEN